MPRQPRQFPSLQVSLTRSFSLTLRLAKLDSESHDVFGVRVPGQGLAACVG